MVQNSQLDQADINGLTAYHIGFGPHGDPKFDCERCTDLAKEKLGCGFYPQYRHQGQGWPKQQYQARWLDTCPGYYLHSPFVSQVAAVARWRKNLGDPRALPNRLIQALELLDGLQAQREAEEARNRARREKAQKARR